MSTKVEEGPIEVSHSVISQSFDRYEPFYVSSDVIPAHDERFIGYGFTRSSQVSVCRIRTWRFRVSLIFHTILQKWHCPLYLVIHVVGHAWM